MPSLGIINRVGWTVTACLGTFALLGASLPAHADSWAWPETRLYYSQNSQFCFTVDPPSLTSPLTTCRGTLTTPDQNGNWRVVWSRNLANKVAPVSALVAGDGRHVVTLDEWHSVGYGTNVVVIYGPEGQFIRNYALEDFVGKFEQIRLQRSVSSRWWGGKHRLSDDDRYVVLEVVANGPPPIRIFLRSLLNPILGKRNSPSNRELGSVIQRTHIELATGKIRSGLAGRSWWLAGIVIWLGWWLLRHRRRRRLALSCSDRPSQLPP